MKTTTHRDKFRPSISYALKARRYGFVGFFIKLAILLLGMVAGDLWAITFYVRTDGNNTNSGTSNTVGGAWRTIQKAASTMRAGDTVIVADGTYLENVTTGTNGLPGGRITFQAQSTNAIVTSFEVTKSYITIAGFTLTGESPSIYGSVCVNTGGNYLNVISNVFQGSRIGVYQLYVNIYAINVQGLTAIGNKFLNGWGHAVALSSGGGHVISNNFFSNPNGYDAFRVSATNILIVANTFTNWASVPLTSGPLKVGATYFFLNLGNSAEMNWSNVGCPKYYRAGTNFTFIATGTTPTKWGSAVIASASNRVIYPVKNHELLTIGQRYYFQFIYIPQWDEFSNVQDKPTRLTGLDNCWTATGTTPNAWGYAIVGYSSNIILTNGQSLVPGQSYYFLSNAGKPNFDNVGAAPLSVYLAGEAYAFTATNTTPINWGTGAILVNANHPDIIQAFQDGSVGTIPPDRPAWDLVFERNFVIDCPVQLGNITDDGNYKNINRWTFRNNVFVRVSNTLNLYAPGFNFYNNTFYRCATNSGFVVIWGVSSAGTASDMRFYNNIMFECGYPNAVNSGWYGGTVASNQLSDYNLVIGSGAGTTKDYSMWTGNGREVHGINGAPPLFVCAASNDFRLQTGSPAIGAGTNLSAFFSADYKGTPRGAAWDMGAYQYESGSQATPSPPKKIRVKQ